MQWPVDAEKREDREDSALHLAASKPYGWRSNFIEMNTYHGAEDSNWLNGFIYPKHKSRFGFKIDALKTNESKRHKSTNNTGKTIIISIDRGFSLY